MMTAGNQGHDVYTGNSKWKTILCDIDSEELKIHSEQGRRLKALIE